MPTTVTAITSVNYRNDVNDALRAHFGTARGDVLRFMTFKQSGANQVAHSSQTAAFDKFETNQLGANDSQLRLKTNETVAIEITSTPDLITRIDIQRLNSANVLQSVWGSFNINPGLNFANGGTLLITANGIKQVDPT